MQSPNEVTALIAMFWLALAAWGYRGAVVVRRPQSGVQWMMRGVALGAAAIFALRFQWDVIVALIRLYDRDGYLVALYVGNWLNAVWNLALAYAGYCVLRGLLLFIPMSERSKYSVLTVAFYPRNPFAQIEAQLAGLVRAIRRRG